MRTFTVIFLMFGALLRCAAQNADEYNDINTILMETTFMIVGPSARFGEGHGVRCGTGFVISRYKGTSYQPVLITAKHVFEDIKGDAATLKLRSKSGAHIVIKDVPVKIRENGKPLYLSHTTEDVAAIDLTQSDESLLTNTGKLGVNFLVPDDYLQSIEIHPGDEMLTLGFPFCRAANDAGYPILRSGKLASYPIFPTKIFSEPLFDFRVYPGNSGGPVYFSYPNRMVRGDFRIAKIYRGLFGMVVEKAGPQQGTDPEIGIIVPAVFIRELVEQLSETDSKANASH